MSWRVTGSRRSARSLIRISRNSHIRPRPVGAGGRERKCLDCSSIKRSLHVGSARLTSVPSRLSRGWASRFSISRTVSEDGTATVKSPYVHEIQLGQRGQDVLERALPLSHNRGHNP